MTRSKIILSEARAVYDGITTASTFAAMQRRIQLLESRLQDVQKQAVTRAHRLAHLDSVTVSVIDNTREFSEKFGSRKCRGLKVVVTTSTIRIK